MKGLAVPVVSLLEQECTSWLQAPEEDVVSLIVQCCYLATLEVWVLSKQGRKHPSYPPPHQSVEILQNKLCLELPCPPMPLYCKPKVWQCLCAK